MNITVKLLVLYVKLPEFILLQEQTSDTNQNSGSVTSDQPSVMMSIINGELSAQEWLMSDFNSQIVHSHKKKTNLSAIQSCDSWVLVRTVLLPNPIPVSYTKNKYISPSRVVATRMQFFLNIGVLKKKEKIKSNQRLWRACLYYYK